jgi:predicted alpha/beta hydrolase family esterase
MPKSMLPIPLLLVPGWRNSGPHHWQSRWQLLHPEMARVDFGEWHHPHPRAWTDVLHQAVLASPSPPLLIAHSLGCLAVANVMALGEPPSIAGALLVAPPDPNQAQTPAELAVFAPPARPRFQAPGLVVVSSTDIYSRESYGVALAQAWGLEVVLLGASGHINDESGHGDWPEGLALLEGLLGRIARGGSLPLAPRTTMWSRATIPQHPFRPCP